MTCSRADRRTSARSSGATAAPTGAAASRPRLGAEIAPGDSVAVDGVCLTATEADARRLRGRGDEPDAAAHLARRPRGRATGSTSSWRCGPPTGSAATSSRATSTASARSSRSRRTASPAGSGSRLGPELLRYAVERGSIALDGVSLTVSGPRRGLARGLADPRDARADDPRRGRAGAQAERRVRRRREVRGAVGRLSGEGKEQA